MAQILLQADRAYPAIPTVGSTLESQRTAIEAIVESIQIHERRTKDTLKSFVRVDELITLGLIEVDGNIILDGPTEESSTHHHDSVYIRQDGDSPAASGLISFAAGISVAAGLTVTGGGAAITGGLTATSYGGVLEINLLDKSAVETIEDVWTFSAEPDFDLGINIHDDYGISWDDELYIDRADGAGGNDDEDFASVTLLMSFDGTTGVGNADFTDLGPIGHTLTYGTQCSSYDAVDAKAGFGQYLLLDGNNSRWVSAPYHTGFDLSGDFTIQWWVLRVGWNVVSYQFGCADFVNGGYYGWIGRAGENYEFRLSDNGANLIIGARLFEDLTLGEWAYMEVNRSGSTVRVFCNGNLVGSTTDSTNMDANGNVFVVGAARQGSLQSYDDIEDFRLTKGVARNTTNYTPPAVPHPFGSTPVGVLQVGSASNDTTLRGINVNIEGLATFDSAATFDDTVDITGALTALSYGGITEANLLDKTATEEVTGAYKFTNVAGLEIEHASEAILNLDAPTARIKRAGVNIVSANSGTINFGPDGSTYLAVNSGGIDVTGDIDTTGDVGGATIGGITEANLVDKTAAESITGLWDFAQTVDAPNFSGDYVQFDTTYADGVAEGKLQWNIEDGTLEFGLPGGQVNLQIGQEQVIRCRNTTGSLIDNGAVVYITGASGNKPLISLADATASATSSVLGVATEDIADNANGYVTISGLVRDVDTDGMATGADLWLDNSPGVFTDTRPVPPAQLVAVGTVISAHASTGVILVHPDPAHRESDLDLLYVGTALDSPVVDVTSNGTTITLAVTASGGGDTRFVFSTGTLILDTDPSPATVALTPGTDIAPTLNYVYLLESTGALTVSTSSWPVAEHAPIATVLCQSAASAQTDGLYKVHAWTDHVANSEKGHLGHLNYWIRSRPAGWVSGALAVVTAGASTFDLAVSSGEILQLHPHAFPSFDTSTGSEVMVINDSITPYVRTGDLTGITLDVNGASLNNKYFNLVVWGVISEDSEDCQIMVNLPNGSYNTQADALVDIDGTAIYDIPSEYVGVGFLIARLTMRLTGGTTYTESLNTDLRGQFPSTGAGGTGGGGGVTELIELTDVDTAADTANFILATPDGVTGQYSGRLLVDADIAESLVTQHEAALTIAETQITDGSLLARVGEDEDVTGAWNFNGILTHGTSHRYNNAVGASWRNAGNTSWVTALEMDASDNFRVGHVSYNTILQGPSAFTENLALNVGGQSYGNWQVMSGNSLYINSADNLENIQFNHNGTDGNIIGNSSADLNLQGFTGNLDLQTGIGFRIRGDDNTAYLNAHVNPSDNLQFDFTNVTDWDINNLTSTNLKGGSSFRVYDAANTGFIHMDTDVTVAASSAIWLHQGTPAVGNYALLSAGGNVYVNAPTGSSVITRINNSSIFTVGAAGGAMTGTLSATGAVTGSNLNVANWDTAYGWGDHAGLYEDADAAIVKSDEAEVITAAWKFTSASGIEIEHASNAILNLDCSTANIQRAGTNILVANAGSVGIGPAGVSNLVVSAANLNYYGTSDSIFSLHQSDLTGDPGTPLAGWNYIQFMDGDGDRQGYFGISSTGDFIFAPEVAGAVVRVGGDAVVTEANWTSHINSIPASYITSGVLDPDRVTLVDVQDTRAVDDDPQDYSYSVGWHFKQRATLGFPGDQTYGGVLAIAPWTDGGGGGPQYQFTFSELSSKPNLSVRMGTGTTWGTWYSVFSEANFTDNSTNWDLAYGWGDHASGGYAASAHTHDGIADTNLVDKSAAESISGAWNFSSTALVLSGHYYHNLYDATNMYVHYYAGEPAAPTFANLRVSDGAASYKTLVIGGDGTLDFDGIISGTNIFDTNWDNAYSWGDHDLVGYLTAVQAADVDAEASADGYVLTSDGAGNAAWEAAAGGGGGDVSVSGTPNDNYLAVWVDNTTIEGDLNLQWDGSEFDVTGQLIVRRTGQQLTIFDTAGGTDAADYGYLELNSDLFGFVTWDDSASAIRSAISISVLTGEVNLGNIDAQISVNNDLDLNSNDLLLVGDISASTGTFSNANFGQFEINRISDTLAAAIKFSNNDGVKGYVGFDDGGTFTFWDAAIGLVSDITSDGHFSTKGIIKSTVLSTGAVNSFHAESALPAFWWVESDQTTDEKGWKMYVSGADFKFYTTNDAGSAADAVFICERISGDRLGDTTWYRDGVQIMNTQQRDGTGNTSGLVVRDHQGTEHDAGFNVLDQEANNTSFTLAAQHCGMCTIKSTSTARTITLPASGSVDFPIDGVFTLYNRNATGNYTINSSTNSVSLYKHGDSLEGGASANFTLGPGGVCTIHRQSTTVYVCYGANLAIV